MDSGQFREWFRDQLIRREWSQRDFSRRSGISPSTVSEWHRGTRVPDPVSIDRIADVFGLPVDDVLTLAGHRPATEPIKPNDLRAILETVGTVVYGPEGVTIRYLSPFAAFVGEGTRVAV